MAMSITHPNMLAQAEAFYWIVRLGGFHAASRHMNLTQPTISVRIRELEASLGEKLFHRDRTQVALTPAGERAFAYAEKMLNLASALRHGDDSFGGLHGVFHIGAVESVAFAFLPQLMVRVQRTLPGLDHSVTVDGSRNLATMLTRQTLDLAILSDPKTDPMLKTVLLGQTEVQWICRRELVSARAPLTVQMLSDIPIFTHMRDSRLFEVTRDWFWTRNASPRTLVCNSLTLMAHFVSQGYGAAILPTNMVHKELKSGRLLALRSDPPIATLPMFLSYNTNRDGPALQSVISILSTEAQRSTLFTRAISARRQVRLRNEN